LFPPFIAPIFIRQITIELTCRQQDRAQNFGKPPNFDRAQNFEKPQTVGGQVQRFVRPNLSLICQMSRADPIWCILPV